MYIEKLKRTYKVSSEDNNIISRIKSFGEDIPEYSISPGILEKLNSVIDWSRSTDQNKVRTDSLEVGSVFLLEGRPQIIAVVNEDTLKLVKSETGPGALKRIVSEIIEPEFRLFFSDSKKEINVEYSKVPDLPKSYEGLYKPGYEEFKFWRSRFFYGRSDWDEDNFIMKILLSGEDYPFPLEIYFYKYGVIYDQDLMDDPRMIKIATEDIFSWFYHNVPVLGRMEFETERAERESDEKRIEHEKSIMASEDFEFDQDIVPWVVHYNDKEFRCGNSNGFRIWIDGKDDNDPEVQELTDWIYACTDWIKDTDGCWSSVSKDRGIDLLELLKKNITYSRR